MNPVQSARCTVTKAFADSCFCFNDTATTEIYPRSLHDALPICDAASTGEDQVLIIAAPGLLANDTDADSGDTRAVVAVNAQAAAAPTTTTFTARARMTVQACGRYRYHPNGQFESHSGGHSATDP